MGTTASTGRAGFFSFTDSLLFLHRPATCHLLARKCHRWFFLRVSLNALPEAGFSASSSRKASVDASGCFFLSCCFILNPLIVFALRQDPQCQLCIISLQFSLSWCGENSYYFLCIGFHIQTVFLNILIPHGIICCYAMRFQHYIG